jgi:hypothetical protein
MFWGRDFEIFDEPGLEVPDGLRAAPSLHDEAAATAAAPAGPVRLSPAAHGTDHATPGLLERAHPVGDSSGGLAGRAPRRTAAVAALVVAGAAAVSLLAGGDQAGGSDDRPKAEDRRVAPSDTAARRAAVRRGSRSGRHLGPAARRPGRERPRLRGHRAAMRSVALTAPPPAPTAPPPPVAAAPEPTPRGAPGGRLPAPAAPASPFEP